MTLELTRPTMMCEGGPWDGWAYHVTDWERRREVMIANGHPTVEFYVPDLVKTEDGRKVIAERIHPRTGGRNGGQKSQRWVWRPPADYDDPYAGARGVSGDRRADVINAIASCGRRGGRLGEIAAAMPYAASPHMVAPLVHTLKQEGVVEASSNGYDPWYRIR